MSRFKIFARSLVSGYALIGVNVIYTLMSVPVALHYLSKDEFGLWALITGITGYLALIDLGMTGSVARILVDYKDKPASGDYGSVIQTGFLVTLVQATLVLGLSTALVFVVGTVPGVPAALTHEFRWLMLGQCAFLAFGFLGRTFTNLLWAHQRTDAGNYAQMVALTINLGVLWFCFQRGAGLYSMLWGSAAATVTGLVLTAGICARLKLFPPPGCWGLPSWVRFRELFTFGKDFFLFALGSQMVNASQTILITMWLGLEATAVWSVCTRTYNALTPLVWRILDISATPLSEMFVRGERERFFARFRDITVLTAAMAVVAGVLFATCNQPFVQFWTGGKVGWSPLNDTLLGAWLALVAVQRCHCGLAGVKKQLGGVKYIYFIEGSVFIGLAALFARQWGVTAIIGSSIVATLGFSFLYGLRQTKTGFNLSWPNLLGWLKPAGMILVIVLPPAVVARWIAGFLPALGGLMLTAGVITGIGGWGVIRWGLDAEMRQRLGKRLPRWLSPLFGAVSKNL